MGLLIGVIVAGYRAALLTLAAMIALFAAAVLLQAGFSSRGGGFVTPVRRVCTIDASRVTSFNNYSFSIWLRSLTSKRSSRSLRGVIVVADCEVAPSIYERCER